MPNIADAKICTVRKLRSKKSSKVFSQRKAIIEPINGQNKEDHSLRCFLLYGPEKKNGEWHR